MYSTCLFCHGQLGRNEALEHFQVGRRLAYDANVGRLWVICSHCHRWNLSPIETRWEAIEDAERAFSATRLRVSTDNIALAQMREGLELVRIGTPPKLELAGWRYGNMFAKRWRKHAVVAGVSAAASAAYFGLTIGPTFVPTLGQFAMLGSLIGIGSQAVFFGGMMRDRKKVRFHVRDNDGQLLGLTRDNARGASLRPVDGSNDWRLQFTYRGYNGRNYSEERTGYTVLQGDLALRAVSTLLPYLNRSGGRAVHVRDAVSVIENNANVRELFSGAAQSRNWKRVDVDLIVDNNPISQLPQRLRLAMEMVLHENSERDALDGELDELHERWKEAEEIGKIADSLT